MYGQVTIDGKQYTERGETFPIQVSITSNLQVLTNQNFTFPGVANFLLKQLTRKVYANIAGVITDVTGTYPFKFKYGNSDGNTWFMAAGINAITDRVIDSCVFGTAQFPATQIPYVFYSSGSSFMYEVEDVSNIATTNPYVIYIGLIGSYLIPLS